MVQPPGQATGFPDAAARLTILPTRNLNPEVIADVLAAFLDATNKKKKNAFAQELLI